MTRALAAIPVIGNVGLIEGVAHLVDVHLQPIEAVVTPHGKTIGVIVIETIAIVIVTAPAVLRIGKYYPFHDGQFYADYNVKRP